MQYVRLENTDFEGLNNVYVLQHEGGTTLVDSGMHTGEMYDQLVAGLADAGTAVEDVDRVLLTHWHPDHVGQAATIAAESGASVHIHEADAPLVRGSAWRQMETQYERLFDEWGMPADKRDRLRERFDLEDDVLSGDEIDAVAFRDGDTFAVGSMELEVMHAPGHTAGMSCFTFEGEDGPAVFSGDALLPVYTPNVGGADIRVERPLETYLGTLVALVERDFSVAWPGHRDRIDDPSGRAREILAHHRDRTERVRDVVAEHGPVDAWSVGAHLFGDLDDIHILHGPGEAYAHLDHLARAGVLDSQDGEYTLADPDADLDALFPDLEFDDGE
jgi:hydroxyacylglutathione hydrolase